MAKLYFSDLRKAQRVAKKRGKSVYKMYEGRYFVGTYEQAKKRCKWAFNIRWEKIRFINNVI